MKKILLSFLLISTSLVSAMDIEKKENKVEQQDSVSKIKSMYKGLIRVVSLVFGPLKDVVVAHNDNYAELLISLEKEFSSKNSLK